MAIPPNPPAPPINTVADTPDVHGGFQSVFWEQNGQFDPHNPELGPAIVVNPREFGITGWGDDNAQQYQSGHTNNVVTNDSADQGWGVGPERKWAHYPTADNPNPFRRSGVMPRDGGDTYSNQVYRPEVVAYWAQALGHEISQSPVKQRSPVSPVVNQPASQPFVGTVPNYVAGPTSPGGYYG